MSNKQVIRQLQNQVNDLQRGNKSRGSQLVRAASTPASPDVRTTVGNTNGYLVAAIDSTGDAKVWDLDGNLVWAANIMPYNTGGASTDIMFDGDDLVAMSGDMQHLVTVDSSGTTISDITIGDSFWTGAFAWPGRLTKNINGVSYPNTDGTVGGRAATGPFGDLDSTPGERTLVGFMRSSDSYTIAWPFSTTGGSGIANSAIWNSATGAYVSQLNMVTSAWNGSIVMGDIDRVTNTAWFVGKASGGTTHSIIKTVLSTNVSSSDVTGLANGTLTFAWIPPWGGTMYYATSTTISTRTLGSGGTTQQPSITSPGGTVNQMDGGWVNGRKFACVASGSGLTLCDAGGIVWQKAGNYQSCAFRGSSPGY